MWSSVSAVSSDEYYRLVAIQVIVLGVLDVVSTMSAFASYNWAHAYEANPIARSLLATGPGAYLLAKIIAIIAVVFLAIVGKKYIETVPYWRYWMYSTIAVGCFVVMKNFVATAIHF